MTRPNSPKDLTSNRVRLALVLVSTLGTLISIYLSGVYYQGISGSGAFKAFCDVGELASCSSVIMSPEARLFGGIPVSSFAAGWYFFLALLALVTFLPEWALLGAGIGFALSSIGVLFSLYLLYLMLFKIGHLCLFCLTLDAVALATLLLWWLLGGLDALRTIKQAGWPKGTGSKVQILSFALSVSALIWIVILRPSQNDSDRIAEQDLPLYLTSFRSTPKTDLRLGEHVAIFGDPAAPVEVVDFSDFLCPHCKKAALLLKTLITTYPKSLRVRVMHFPLEAACNSMIPSGGHEGSCELARGAICAHQQGRGTQYHERIFDHQETIRPDNWKNLLSDLGLNMETWTACVEAEATKQQLALDIAEGIRLQLHSTPTLFVQNRRIDGLTPFVSGKPSCLDSPQGRNPNRTCGSTRTATSFMITHPKLRAT
jgi:uncharacterized membrane protein